MGCEPRRFFLLWTAQLTFLSLFASGQISQSEAEPEFLQPLENLTVTQGRDVVFTCVVNHLGQYKVAWIKSDSKAILAIHTHLVAHNLRLSVTHNGHNTWKLHISNVQKNDSGTYMCQINTDPMRSQMGHLEIVVPPDILNDESSDSGVALEGGSIRLRCKATGVPDPTVQWKREDSRNIVLRHDGGREKTVERIVKGDILTLTNVQRSDIGIYLCIASNGVPPSVSKRFMVQVHFQPSIQVTNQLVAAPVGSDVILQCYVEASPQAMNSWYKDKGEKLIEGVKYSLSEQPISEYGLIMNLTIRSIEKRDLGAYTCSSSNALGTASGAVRLQEIYMPPKTTISPKSNNNIHFHHKPTHSPKKSKIKSRKEEAMASGGGGAAAAAAAAAAATTSTTTLEPTIYQTINPSISRPPFWVIEEESNSGSSKMNFLSLPLINLCSMTAILWRKICNSRVSHWYSNVIV